MQNVNSAFSSASSTQALFQAASDRPANAKTLVPPAVVAGVTRAVELAALTGLGIAIAAAQIERQAAEVASYTLAAVPTAMAASAMFQASGLYSLHGLMNTKAALPRLLTAWTLALLGLVLCLAFAAPDSGISIEWAVLWLATGSLVLVLGRLALAGCMRQWSREGRLMQRAVIYGSGAPCQTLLDAIAADPDNNINVCGIYDNRVIDRDAMNASGKRGGTAHHGSLDDLIGYARSSRIDLVLLALPISAETRLMQLLQNLWILPADICLAGSSSRLRLAPGAYAYAGNVELIALADKPISDWGLVAKSVFDRVVGALALVALAPVMLATAIAIRLETKGPVLFRQKRYGFNNELIEVYKFRSMHADMTDNSAEKLVTKEDPRVTRVGRFIRKTSLDELPQLFNVLIGNLSLVGPRPHAISAKAGERLYPDVVGDYFARHKVKPGITGWAQVNGWRGETDTEEKLRHRIEHDLYYIENWSLAFDAEILLKTPLSLLKDENAY